MCNDPRVTRVVIALAALVALASGCSSPRVAATSQSYVSTQSIQPAAEVSHSAFRGPERFCSDGRKGQLRYALRGGKPRFTLHLTHLPARRSLGVFWATGSVHEAQLVASFKTGPSGRPRPSSVRTFLAAQRRGIAIKIVMNNQKVVASLTPCP